MERIVIRGRLYDGRAQAAIENGAVAVCGGCITYVGATDGCAALPEDLEIRVTDGTILPGLIDCHAHLCGQQNRGGHMVYDALLTAAHELPQLLEAGFTTVRDMSLFSPALKRAQQTGQLRGPRIVAGGRLISSTSGHGDMSPELPKELINRSDLLCCLADGVDECLKTVRDQFRDGVDFIKISATGGVSSQTDGLDDVQFSDAEIAAITAEAARHGSYVAAHCSGAAGTLQALQNGVGCVEHGIDLDEACIALMQQRDIPVVTTLFVSQLVAVSDKFPPFMREKGRLAAQKHRESMQRAHRAGLCIACGTDFANSEATPFRRNGLELCAIVEAGFTPMEAIRIATYNSARAIRRERELGSLEFGKRADIIIASGNPLEDISRLSDAAHIPFVMQDGIIQKNVL